MRILGFDPSSRKVTAFAAIDLAAPYERPKLAPIADAFGEIEATPFALGQLVTRVGAEMLSVESPSGGVWARARGADLLELGKVATRLAEWGRALGLPVWEAPAQDVRRSLLPSGTKQTDANISTLITRWVSGWPAPRKTNNHERDAAMAAIFGGRMHMCAARDARGGKAATR